MELLWIATLLSFTVLCFLEDTSEAWMGFYVPSKLVFYGSVVSITLKLF